MITKTKKMTDERQIEVDGEVTFDVNFTVIKGDYNTGCDDRLEINDVKHSGVSFYNFLSQHQFEEIDEKLQEMLIQEGRDRSYY